MDTVGKGLPGKGLPQTHSGWCCPLATALSPKPTPQAPTFTPQELSPPFLQNPIPTPQRRSLLAPWVHCPGGLRQWRWPPTALAGLLQATSSSRDLCRALRQLGSLRSNDELRAIGTNLEPRLSKCQEGGGEERGLSCPRACPAMAPRPHRPPLPSGLQMRAREGAHTHSQDQKQGSSVLGAGTPTCPLVLGTP